MFFLVRELSLTLMEEEENKLPLTKDKDCVKIDNILDLSKFALLCTLACKVYVCYYSVISSTLLLLNTS